MTIVFRAATREDGEAVAAVHRAAFPTDAEARLVAALERDGDVLLSLVAARDGEIVGHVLFSRMEVDGGARPPRAAALAPVAVLPARQGAGIGSGLIDTGLGLLAERDIDIVFVLGDPDFYEAFGFDPALARRFASPYAGEQWMALALNDRPPPKRGEARHARAFAELGGAA